MKKPERTMHREKRWGIVLALIILLGGLAAAFYPREPLLLEHATRVLDMRAADPSEGMNYAWLSDHELLYFRSSGTFCRFDTETGGYEELLALTRQVKSSIPDLEALSHDYKSSPDGQSVLWGPTSNAPVFVGAIDGMRRWKWPMDARSNSSGIAFWMADSQHWAEWMYGSSWQGIDWTQVKIHSLATPQVSQTISSLPSDLKRLEILSVQSEDNVIARTRDGEKIIDAGPPGSKPFIFNIDIDYRDTQEVSIWSLHRRKPLHHYTIHLPGLVLQVKASPHGDRLVWLVRFQSVSPLLKKIRRFIPVWKEDKRLSLALYVSDLDGSHLQEIGRVKRNPKPVGDVIKEIHWLPGGKQLSFILDDTLWTVPVE